MMPQKKNPDFAELVRGRSARLIGQLNHLLVVVKGLPLSYNRDLQEDKVALFDAFDTARSCTRVVCAMLESIQFQREAIEGALAGDFSNATELADGLAKLGVPFREAHEVTGRVVRWCISNQRTLESMTAAELKSIDPVIPASFDVECLTHRSAFQSRNSEGGTAPNRVREQIARARAELA
jgi:argininosuccinate lyase